MSLKALIALSKINQVPKLCPNGEEYLSKTIVGADKGHWRVEYTRSMPGGYSYSYFWERMTNKEMRDCQCYADDYQEENK